jgi:predicted DsbA family dithiol-disulfide isomerase
VIGRAEGSPVSIPVRISSDITRISNSRPALQAAEFSRDQGRFDAFHDALLQAYFAAGLDIGDREVIAQHAGERTWPI